MTNDYWRMKNSYWWTTHGWQSRTSDENVRRTPFRIEDRQRGILVVRQVPLDKDWGPRAFLPQFGFAIRGNQQTPAIWRERLKTSVLWPYFLLPIRSVMPIYKLEIVLTRRCF
jgi:hypothetical protein